MVWTRSLRLGLAAVSAGVLTAGPAAASVRASSGWGTAITLPGIATLNHGNSQVVSMSCPAPGDCAAAGSVWAKAEEIPGTAALNTHGFAQGDAVSCPSARHCSLGGTYNGAGQQGFVAQQSGGVWADAEAIPGLAALNQGGLVELSSLSCGAAGDCAAGGSYFPSATGTSQVPFVVSETGGVWDNAEPVPGLAAFSTGSFESLNSVSCSSAGECSAGGVYSTAAAPAEAFVVDETGGTWQAAQEVPGTAELNTGGSATVFAAACAPGGSCTLGGDYRNINAGTNGHEQAFIDSQG